MLMIMNNSNYNDNDHCNNQPSNKDVNGASLDNTYTESIWYALAE